MIRWFLQAAPWPTLLFRSILRERGCLKSSHVISQEETRNISGPFFMFITDSSYKIEIVKSFLPPWSEVAIYIFSLDTLQKIFKSPLECVQILLTLLLLWEYTPLGLVHIRLREIFCTIICWTHFSFVATLFFFFCLFCYCSAQFVEKLFPFRNYFHLICYVYLCDSFYNTCNFYCHNWLHFPNDINININNYYLVLPSMEIQNSKKKRRKK